jgi:hypothetical protein
VILGHHLVHVVVGIKAVLVSRVLLLPRLHGVLCTGRQVLGGPQVVNPGREEGGMMNIKRVVSTRNEEADSRPFRGGAPLFSRSDE